MQAPPLRLRSPGPSLPAAAGAVEGAARPGWAGWVRGVLRGLGVLGVTAGAAPVQAGLLWLPGRGKVVWARWYWAALCRVMGLRVRVVGARPVPGGRAVVYAANHSSWLDILAIGGSLDGCFVAKAEVGRWPVVRTVARLGRTVFVSRRAQDTGRERDAMRARLAGGDSLVLFPEGTSSDGSRVLAFRSAFFSAVDGEGGAAVQPVSVVYDRMGGLPVGRASRAGLAWFGDMALGPHWWGLARRRGGMRVTVMVHPAVEPGAFASRKALAAAVWATVAEGAAALRQNRGG